MLILKLRRELPSRTVEPDQPHRAALSTVSRVLRCFFVSNNFEWSIASPERMSRKRVTGMISPHDCTDSESRSQTKIAVGKRSTRRGESWRRSQTRTDRKRQEPRFALYLPFRLSPYQRKETFIRGEWGPIPLSKLSWTSWETSSLYRGLPVWHSSFRLLPSPLERVILQSIAPVVLFSFGGYCSFSLDNRACRLLLFRELL